MSFPLPDRLFPLPQWLMHKPLLHFSRCWQRWWKRPVEDVLLSWVHLPETLSNKPIKNEVNLNFIAKFEYVKKNSFQKDHWYESRKDNYKVVLKFATNNYIYLFTKSLLIHEWAVWSLKALEMCESWQPKETKLLVMLFNQTTVFIIRTWQSPPLVSEWVNVVNSTKRFHSYFFTYIFTNNSGWLCVCFGSM